MPIFRYTLKKILISPSTWVIFVLTLIILGLAWSLPSALLRSNQDIKIQWTKELVLSFFLTYWKALAFSAFISLMLLIFIAVKATQIFRDEIDDGTLLILVSKPISRNRIWLEKWLSFQVIVVLYIFFSILFSGLLLAIPGIGGLVVYLTLLPYMAILFAIALIFDLIFTSIILLLSLLLNSKATIAIAVGLAALTNVFSQTIDPLVSIPAVYFQISHAVAVLHDLESKLSANDMDWFKEQLNNENYQDDIDTILKKVYQTDIKDIANAYPDFAYDPIREQAVVKDIVANRDVHQEYSVEEVILLSHILNITSVFRQWKEQSYRELMTSRQAGNVLTRQPHGKAIPGSNGVNYGVYDVFESLNTIISKEDLEKYNTKILQKRIMRYFNIFYQLYYLWNGAWKENNSLYLSNSEYQKLDDPYLISFDENPDNTYQVAFHSGTNKLLNFSVLLIFYLFLGLSLLVTSWYVFNRRDFA